MSRIMDYVIRRETEADYRQVEHLTREAFWNVHLPGCDEHYLAHVLRRHPDFIAELDYVADFENRPIGSIMYTKSAVVAEDESRIDTITFGPLSVLPEFQRMGVGSALVKHTIDLARSSREKAIIILGHPHNYCKYGFQNSQDFLISDAAGRYPYGQLVLELEKEVFGGGKWRFFYSNAFEVDSQEALAFDAGFPPKKRAFQPSQVEFSIAVRAYLD